MPMHFTILTESSTTQVRAGEFHTTRNVLHTPCFMPVGTHGAVTGLTPAMLTEMGAEILVSNAFRLSEKPGNALLSKYADLHEFMGWDKTILTDSGGFQSRLREHAISEQGIQFYDDNAQNIWTPEHAIETQLILGSDFVMPLDICVELPTTYPQAKDAMERTLRWAARSQAAFTPRPGQILFGIIQGAVYPDLRQQCIDALEKMEFPAYAIGGLNVGETPQEYQTTLSVTTALLPREKLRYIMGVGRPEAMLEAVRAGVDIMDSIIPTKYARERTLFTFRGPINLGKKKKYRRDKYPIDPNCRCYTCRHVSRAYLHHLYSTTTTTAQIFAAIHNVSFCLRVLQDARQAILDDRFEDYYAAFMDNYTRKS
ncbi:tRNA guanosine(34) transglycosylase Tgt [candidate division KSB3 bacterium]|uniref:tRNA guanosine(34) transglycosylase Tgt n=1 Tax=candidate division KSB3 bacterium TaxID=2044937 RepID=A0A9D5Q491_9BACT|nr:tRNA guanosine(34) transglycosylase Tgt [candidate division KSB3 bacterium]MBD3323474.1 tRNA guanosine(34) transglycosylase Tgt [candidate division KSB3 bacterium]